MREYLEQMRDEMKRQIEEAETALKRLPKGSLYMQKSKEGIRLYWDRIERKGKEYKREVTRLFDSDYSIALGIRQRRIQKQRLKALKHNFKGVDKALERYLEDEEKELILQLEEPYRSLLGIRKPQGEEFKGSQSENPIYREELIHENSVGELFRSKAEMQISELLIQMQIPYRYEKRLNMGNEHKYPDFTLKKPGSGKFVYIEYFGMIDKEEYQYRMFRTINWYLDHQLIPGREVLFLYENSKCGMKLPVVTKQIRDFLDT